MLAVVTLPHGQITPLSGEATLPRGLSHHRITLVARLGRALVAEHQAESSLRVQQLLMRLRVAARPLTTTPYPPPSRIIGVSSRVSPFLLSTLLIISWKASRVRHVRLKRNVVGGVFSGFPIRALRLPS